VARRLQPEDLEDRIDCFGEFDRGDAVCLLHCSLNFECAAARERMFDLQLHDESLEALGISHSA
jgi:hypothetical protein